MKRLIAKSLMLAGGMTLSSQLMALGLGEMTLKSALNQPLRAEIDLVDADDLSKWEIKPSLASSGDFDRAGVDRVFFLTKIKFSVEDNKIVLSSREPVTEPFLNFLLELNWPSGRVLREYTVLLDPPVFEEQAINPLVVAPQAAETTATAEVSYDAPQPASQQSNQWLDTPAEPGTYKVQRDDTLWEIALQTRPSTGVSAQQMMLAIQQQNPNAFIGGNINRLKTHQVLRIPNADEINNIHFGQAVAEVERQNQALQGGAQLDATGRRSAAEPVQASANGGEVRLLSAGSDVAESAGASGDVQGQGFGRQQEVENDLAIALETLDKSRLENQELRQRLEALEEQINTLQRLITLKDDQLASIQVDESLQQEAEQTATELTESESAETEVVAEEQVADVAQAEEIATDENIAVEEAREEAGETEASEVAETPDSGLTEEAVADAEEVASGEEVDFNYQEESADPAAVAAEVEAQKAEDEARRQRIAAMLAQQEAQNRPQPGFIESMLQRPEILGAGLGGLLLLLAGVFKLVQRRKAAKEEEEAFEDQDVTFADGDVDGAELDDIDFSEGDLEPADIDLDSGDLDAVADDDLDLGDLEEESQDDFGAVAQTEDVISESDIYIAYGKFEQAVDLLSGAIDQEPSRSDLRLKLLEVFVEMDDADAFAKQEAQLIAVGDQEANAQAEQLRSRLSTPLAPVADSATEDGMSLDEDIPSLDDSLGDEFSDGLDFGDALDLADGAEGESLDLSDDIPDLDVQDDSSDALDFDLGETADEEPVLDIDGSSEEDIPSLDAEASLEDVPTLDLDGDESLEFDLGGESTELDLSDETEEPVEAPVQQDEDDSLEFDLGELDVAVEESQPEAAEVETAEESEETLEFDLDSLASADDESAVDDLVADLDLSAGDDSEELEFDLDSGSEEELLDIDADGELDLPIEEDEAEEDLLDLSAEIADISAGEEESDTDLSDLESLMNADGSTGEAELPDLSFDMEENTGFAESDDDDLKALEAELDSVAEEPAEDVADEAEEVLEAEELAEPESVEEIAGLTDGVETEEVVEEPSEVDFSANDSEMDFAADLAELDAELEDFEAPVIEAAGDAAPEVPVVEDDIPVVGDAQPEVADQTEEQDIDLDKLAAAEDEFDFLAGTDECATKLDLARAYIDMEDTDGARELLQEVLQEGSDQQKQDARGLMDNLS